ncbi:TraB/GumN family protein [Dyella subtropica]|uniref:TraB/GumN family protein n=1 Tax=Dyella subtropica TaxID=2992127 RepID=UPI00224F04EC|nr:TraB/GumN family protein [Dyella subtropica]
MHGKLATCLCALLLAMPTWAQSAGGAKPADAVRLQTVTVIGIQPGPGLWKVSKGGHVMWVLGTLAPLPKHMKWRSTQVEQAIAQSQELLEPPSAELKMYEGLFNKLALQPSTYSASRNPDGAHLQQILTPEMFARWQALKLQYIGDDSGIERRRPILVAMTLYDKALNVAALTDATDVTDTVMKLARKHDVKRTPVKYQLMVGASTDAAETLKQINQRDLGCLDQTMGIIEHDMAALTTRANAWATGDITTLRDLSPEGRYDGCLVSVANADFAQQLGLENLPERIEVTWLAAARSALARNTQTFAVLPMSQVLSPDGFVAKLKAEGYSVQSPEEQEL